MIFKLADLHTGSKNERVQLPIAIKNGTVLRHLKSSCYTVSSFIVDA